MHEGVTPTENTKSVEKIIEEARKIAIENLRNAKSTIDFLRWHRAVMWLTPTFSSWMFEYYPDLTVEDLIEEYLGETRNKQFQQEARYAEEMNDRVSLLPKKDGKIRVVLKRVREKGSNRYYYRALAVFPEETRVKDYIADCSAQTRPIKEEDIIYFEPANACVEHACDDLFKAHRGETGCVFYLDNLPYLEAMRRIQENDAGVSEYLLEKTEDGTITQEAESFLLVALLGGYGNEIYRVRVSDLWSNVEEEAK